MEWIAEVKELEALRRLLVEQISFFNDRVDYEIDLYMSPVTKHGSLRHAVGKEIKRFCSSIGIHLRSSRVDVLPAFGGIDVTTDPKLPWGLIRLGRGEEDLGYILRQRFGLWMQPEVIESVKFYSYWMEAVEDLRASTQTCTGLARWEEKCRISAILRDLGYEKAEVHITGFWEHDRYLVEVLDTALSNDDWRVVFRDGSKEQAAALLCLGSNAV